MAQETPGPGKVGFQLPLGNTLPAIPWMAPGVTQAGSALMFTAIPAFLL